MHLSAQWMQLAQVADSCEYGDEPSGSRATELFVCCLKFYQALKHSPFFAVVRTKICVLTPCRLVSRCRRFGGTYYLHFIYMEFKWRKPFNALMSTFVGAEVSQHIMLKLTLNLTVHVVV
jgi:hypothetical protein